MSRGKNLLDCFYYTSQELVPNFLSNAAQNRPTVRDKYTGRSKRLVGGKITPPGDFIGITLCL